MRREELLDRAHERRMARGGAVRAAFHDDQLEVRHQLLEVAEARWEQVLPKNGAARAALSAALHDLVGKRVGQPLWRLWGLDPSKAPRSSFTIGLDTTEKIRAKVQEAQQYPILKIKLGTDRDEEILRTIRDATDKPIRVDANAGWSVARAKQMVPVLKDFGVEVSFRDPTTVFVERPAGSGEAVEYLWSESHPYSATIGLRPTRRGVLLR